jgi:fructose-1,6-bisphosphatase I
VRRAGIADVLGITGEQNIQGEIVQKLDRIANETVYRMLDYRGIVGVLGSEEDEEPRFVERGDGPGKYIVLFDPIDGSSNIDVNVSVGTIFSILRRDADDPFEHDPMQDVLQPGVRQLAAGYIVYGSSVVLCYTTGAGVHMFTLDPLIGAYVLTREDIKMPETGKIYSVNEANRDSFPDGYRQYLDWAKTKEAGPYTLRYIGSLVADFHRTLLKGGIFMYPPTAKAPGGKLRLMYEANPMAFLAEQAGGAATDGEIRIVEKQPTGLHQRTPLIIGSQNEVNRVHEFLGKELPVPARRAK